MGSQDVYLLDDHKLYWHLDRVLADRRGELIAPIYVEISPTDRCNHNCIFCGLDFVRGGGHSLDTATLLARIGEMGRLGVRSVNFSGEGEPLLHPDAPALIAACAQAGMDVALATNGSRGDAAAWETMLRHLTWVRFSLDAGSPEVHAQVHRGGADGFQRAVSTVRQAVTLKKSLGSATTIGVQYVLLEQNLDDLERAIRLFQDIGCDYCSIKPFSFHPQMRGGLARPVSATAIEAVAALVAALQPRSPMRLIFRQAAFHTAATSGKSFSSCRALPYWAHLQATGDLYACPTFLGDPRFCLGNIATQTMDALFFGPRRREALRLGRTALDIEGECRLNCRMARINEFLEMLDAPPQHINFI
jgi:radical SAM protein with 4Fe4S-binding SPASM domain